MRRSVFVYRPIRPNLVIEVDYSLPGPCYKVTSWRPLDMKELLALRSAGVLGYGQEFRAYRLGPEGKQEFVPATLGHDRHSTVEATGYDDVPCIEIDQDTGKVLSEDAINPFSGQPYGSRPRGYWVYRCYDVIDSSD